MKHRKSINRDLAIAHLVSCGVFAAHFGILFLLLISLRGGF